MARERCRWVWDRSRTTWAGGAAAAWLLAAGQAGAVVINVPADQPTIAAAIAAAAANGDEIVVAPGVYLQTGTLDPGGKNIHIRSSGGAAVTTIQGSGAASTRVLVFRTGETAAMILDGFTITGGTLGAIRIGGTADGFTADAPPTGNPGASPTIRNCVFENNASASSDGGAITVGLSDAQGFNKGHSTPLIENCTFRNNTGTSTSLSTARGGAINLTGGAPTLRNCTFTGNNHNRAGGALGIAANALVTPNLPVTIEGCTFSGNTSGATSGSAGGCPGIHIAGRNVNIIGSVIENHTYTGTANVGALAIVLAGSAAATPPYTLNLTNTTIRNNYASGTTGAPYRPLVLAVVSSTINIEGGGFFQNGVRASDGVELGFNKGIELSPAAPETCTLNITGATFSGNTTSATTPVGNTALITGRAGATPGAGGVGTLNVTNSAFTNNEVSAIFFNGGAGTVTFTGGSVTGSTGGAGMFVANPIGSFTIRGTTLSGNSGLISVSGASAGSNAGTFLLENATLTANLAGAVAASNFQNASITGGSIGGHTALNTLINFSGTGTHTITGLSVTGNTLPGSSPSVISATGAAGAGSLTLVNSTISGNMSASSSARIVRTTDLASAAITGTELSGNSLTGPGAGLVGFTEVTGAMVTNSRFLDNLNAGGVSYTDSGGSVEGSTFRNNEDGVTANSATPVTLTITGSSFSGGTDSGGSATGISVGDAVSATIRGCRVFGNDDGGITLAGSGTHSIVNTLVTGSTGAAGAVWLGGSSTTSIVNCTLVGNLLSGGPGGVSVNDTASATIVNSISYGNGVPEIDDTGTTGTVAVSFSSVQDGFAGAGNIDAAPTYVDADGADNTPNTADDDFRLASGSAGINVGSNGAVPVGVTTDLAGQARIANVTVDIGAYEFQAAACPADFNNSGTVSVQDIFDFLAAYFAGVPAADFNNSGAISVQDIFDFLAAYFAGCP